MGLKLVKQGMAGMMMPVHFGSRYSKWVGGYGDVTTMSVTYLTDKKRLVKYLPKVFEIIGEPLVIVYYTMNRDIGWLAGGCYNLLGVDVPCIYHGEDDEGMQGKFCLVLWENLTDPILTGPRAAGHPQDIREHRRPRQDRRRVAHLRCITAGTRLWTSPSGKPAP